MPSLLAGLASSTPWPLTAYFACATHAYSTLLGSHVDGLLLLGALSVQCRRQLACHASAVLANAAPAGLPIFALAVTAGIAVAAMLVLRAVFSLVSGTAKTSSSARWTGPGKPLLLPCVTTHARMGPKTHSFAYSYLVVGVPVDWSGTSGGMISVAPPEHLGATGQPGQRRRKGWFDVDAGDYLERGSGHLGLRGKLDAHLREAHGLDPTVYPHAYLVTAARCLGYHFNPVSFWYLYGADRTLSAMILEVNNTFGERRMYFLTPEAPCGDREGDGPALFRQTWPKDFHVSPFNSRKGSYELLANDPLAPRMQGAGPLSATIVLRSSRGHSKIVARLASARLPHAFDPEAASLWQRAWFLLGWWWVGLATLPRIVWQAGILFFSKRLHVWLRPEPLDKSIGRLADATEHKLEAVFRQYLRHLIESAGSRSKTGSSASLAVKYIPCGLAGAASTETFYSQPHETGGSQVAAHNSNNDRAATVMEFRVLTPAFYARFVHYAHDVEALFCELRESCTVSISPPSAAADFAKTVLARSAPPPPLRVTSPVDYVAFKAIQKLRRRPARLASPVTWPKNVYASGSSASSSSSSSAAAYTSSDVRGFRLSAMDGFILSLPGEGRGEGQDAVDLRRTYRSTVLQLFVADRTALGVVPLLQLQLLVLRVGAAWVAGRIILLWL